MDEVAGAASCSEEDLRQFLEFASSFHPNLDYTWPVSTDKLPFLDIYMKPQDNRTPTSIYYKDTDSHSYLNFSSSGIHPVASHPYLIVSFLACVRSAAKTMTFSSRQQKWRPFLQHAVIQMTSLGEKGNEHRPN